ncbi:MAG: glycosyltransferase [Conexivisphaerales archaeon]
MVAKSLPSVSIIIPTYNRFNELMRTIASINNVDYPDKKIEVIIVCDSNDEFKIDMSRAFQYKIIRNRRRNGAATARNIGIANSNGEILVFIDDDVKVDPSWLRNLVNNYLLYKNVAGVAGAILSPRHVNRSNRSIRVGRIGLDGHTYFNFNSIQKVRVDWMRGCNMSVRRTVALKLGGFNSILDPISIAEDIEFSLRLNAANYVLLFEPSAWLIHYESKGGGTRTSISEFAYFATRNVLYTYLRWCKYPKKLSASIRATLGILGLSIRRYAVGKKQKDETLRNLMFNLLKGVVSGLSLAIAKRENILFLTSELKIS